MDVVDEGEELASSVGTSEAGGTTLAALGAGRNVRRRWCGTVVRQGVVGRHGRTMSTSSTRWSVLRGGRVLTRCGRRAAGWSSSISGADEEVVDVGVRTGGDRALGRQQRRSRREREPSRADGDDKGGQDHVPSFGTAWLMMRPS